MEKTNDKAHFPTKIYLDKEIDISNYPAFKKIWRDVMKVYCHEHEVWTSPFVTTISNTDNKERIFDLAALWSVNMVAGSYCFPRYVAALASRSEHDFVRHGLLENAWDESGSHGHTARSHFWLAVKLVRLLGLSEDQIENINPIKEAQLYMDEHFNNCATGNFEFALGMICLIEEFTTPEFTLILRSFLFSIKDVLGISEEDFILNGGAEYFTANISDDERHREEMPELVAIHLHSKGIDLTSEADISAGLRDVRAGIQFSADLRKKFFDGIYYFVTKGGNFRSFIAK